MYFLPSLIAGYSLKLVRELAISLRNRHRRDRLVFHHSSQELLEISGSTVLVKSHQSYDHRSLLRATLANQLYRRIVHVQRYTVGAFNAPLDTRQLQPRDGENHLIRQRVIGITTRRPNSAGGNSFNSGSRSALAIPSASGINSGSPHRELMRSVPAFVVSRMSVS